MTRIIEVTHIGEDYATIKIKHTASEFQTSRGIGEAIIKAYEREERQAQKKQEAWLTVEHFTRLDNDTNGNPRYYVPVYLFPKEMKISKRYEAGLAVYRGKKYGTGYVVQSYNLASTVAHIIATLSK